MGLTPRKCVDNCYFTIYLQNWSLLTMLNSQLGIYCGLPCTCAAYGQFCLMAAEVPFHCQNCSTDTTKEALLHGAQKWAAEAFSRSLLSQTKCLDPTKVRTMAGDIPKFFGHRRWIYSGISNVHQDTSPSGSSWSWSWCRSRETHRLLRGAWRDKPLPLPSSPGQNPNLQLGRHKPVCTTVRVRKPGTWARAILPGSEWYKSALWCVLTFQH